MFDGKVYLNIQMSCLARALLESDNIKSDCSASIRLKNKVFSGKSRKSSIRCRFIVLTRKRRMITATTFAVQTNSQILTWCNWQGIAVQIDYLNAVRTTTGCDERRWYLVTCNYSEPVCTSISLESIKPNVSSR